MCVGEGGCKWAWGRCGFRMNNALFLGMNKGGWMVLANQNCCYCVCACECVSVFVSAHTRTPYRYHLVYPNHTHILIHLGTTARSIQTNHLHHPAHRNPPYARNATESDLRLHHSSFLLANTIHHAPTSSSSLLPSSAARVSSKIPFCVRWIR